MPDADQASNDPNAMARREALELVRAYYRIPDERLCRKVFDLVKAAGPKDADH